MTQQKLDFAELRELKNQFNLLDMKLEKQRIINEEMIQESMKEKLSGIEKSYHYRFRTCTIAAPIISIVFFAMGYHWGFCLLIISTAMLELVLDRKSYRSLNPKELPNLSLTQATENIIKHKKNWGMRNRILLLPTIVLIVWTILIASNYSWNLEIITLTTFMMVVSISWGITQMKKNQKKLESVLEQIKKLRE